MTVDITEVYPDARVVTAKEVRAGDSVFDVFGGTHEVSKARTFTHVTRIERLDGWPMTLGKDDPITILPGRKS